MDQANLFHVIPTGDDVPNEINIIVEIAEGSRVKYEFEKKYGGVIMVDRFLHTPMPYPFSYGLIPQTWNDYDNDPLDALIVSSEPIIAGAICPCKVIGILSVDDTGERDDKVICVPSGDPYFNMMESFEELPLKKREDIQYFMEHYKDLEKGKEVVVKNWDDAQTAKDFIIECMEVYKGKEF